MNIAVSSASIDFILCVSIVLIVLLGIFILFNILRLIVYLLTKKRITHFFCYKKLKLSKVTVLHQSIDGHGRAAAHSLRIKNIGKTPEDKLFAIRCFYIDQLKKLLRVLDAGCSYRTITHLLKGSDMYHFQLQDMPKRRKKRVLFEILPFLGWKDFIGFLCSKKYRTYMVKQFYQIDFMIKK